MISAPKPTQSIDPIDPNTVSVSLTLHFRFKSDFHLQNKLNLRSLGEEEEQDRT